MDETSALQPWKSVVVKKQPNIISTTTKRFKYFLIPSILLILIIYKFYNSQIPMTSTNSLLGPSLTLRLYTNNIRFDNFKYPDPHEKPWSKRGIQSINSMEFNTAIGHANVICLQEVLYNQLNDILNGLNANDNDEWSYYGVGRTDGVKAGEFAPILFKTKDFFVLENTTFWLSPTPSFPSKGWDAALERIVTMVSFQSKLNPLIKFNVFNTHYDHRGIAARRESSKLIVDKMENYNNYPSFLCGDFNTEPKDEPYAILTAAGFKDSRILINPRYSYGHESTFTGFDVKKEPVSIIDYIWSPYFTKPHYPNSLLNQESDINYYNLNHHQYYSIELKQFGILSNYYKGFHFSDHRPVVATYEIERTKLI
ncbi:uncharacterized protein KGF55_003180 [Candida pseudojiufengensis]|uniref:uncharacterized protein n=1 Tax=Candida pseudojiufengensis TaxID=497109 RepID=UPI002224C9A9|nr:uncharacterized protein KGF55_003180 [Candida pseudojiufengensis]KAI5962104.1 hypothetical protein KGF55_003180 [Candida pseudojiufengensis]